MTNKINLMIIKDVRNEDDFHTTYRTISLIEKYF